MDFNQEELQRSESPDRINYELELVLLILKQLGGLVAEVVVHQYAFLAAFRCEISKQFDFIERGGPFSGFIASALLDAYEYGLAERIEDTAGNFNSFAYEINSTGVFHLKVSEQAVPENLQKAVKDITSMDPLTVDNEVFKTWAGRE